MSARIAVMILIAFAAEWRESDANPSVQLLENRTRCLANCYTYDSKASPDYPYVCSNNDRQCIMCQDKCRSETGFDDSFEKCKSTCFGSKAQKAGCTSACEFISNMKTNTTIPKSSDLPRKMYVTTAANGTLKWEQKNGVFYVGSSASKTLAVLYLVLKAEVDPSVYNPANEAQFDWTYAAAIESKAISFNELRTSSTIRCDEHYVFKVAAVNIYGLRSYGPITQMISSEEFGALNCQTWCHPSDCSVPDYCGNHKRTSHLKKPGPPDRNDLYTWNTNCFSPEASRVIEWNPLDVNFTGDYCYSLYLVASYCTEMADRVYFVRNNESSFVLDQLKPDCKIYIFMIAGSRKAGLSDYDQKYELVLKTPDPFSDRNFCSSGDTWFQASEITFNVTTRKYESTLSWRNPPRVPVDRFELIVLFHKKKNSFGRVGQPISVKAKDGTGLIYARDLEFDPGRVYSVTLQPIHSSNGYQSSAVTIIAQALEPPAPINVSIASVPDTSHLLLAWSVEEDEVHEDFPVYGFEIVYSPEGNDGKEDVVLEEQQRIYVNDSTAREFEIPDLNEITNYVVKIKTISVLGKESEYVTVTMLTSSAPFKSKQSVVPYVVPIVVVLVVVIVIVVIVSVLCVGREKKQYEERIHQLELATYHPPHLAPCFNPSEPPDEWEIDPENLNLLEVLGEGFFGIVLKGEVMHNAPANESPSTPRRLGSLSGIHSTAMRSKGSVATVKTVVACKMLKEDGTSEDQLDLLKEVRLMKKIGQHKHIVSVLGSITRSHPICLIVEYCAHGDLQNFLRAARPAWLISNRRKSGSQLGNRYSSLPGTLKESEGYMEMNAAPGVAAAAAASSGVAASAIVPEAGAIAVEVTAHASSVPSTPAKGQPDVEAEGAAGTAGSERPKLTPFDLLSFCRQISAGMDFLSAKGLVHRDLACRNVLVSDGKLLKISDFGLTRAVYKDATYTQKTRSRLPLKWMSIEAITDRVFTVASDVWSFGVVMWEICTLGGFPYPTISNEELLSRLRRGYRMERPDNCSEELYGMMIQCWHPDAEMRPLFSVLVTALDKMLEAEQPNLYVDLNFSATNPFWMSISELSEADSDTEPEVPFQETHLRQVSFDEGNDPNSVLSIALRAVRDSVVVTAPPIDDDAFLPHVDQDGYVEPSELINALGNGNGIESNGDRRIPQNGHSLSATTAL
ncbi:uncharacterized protein [Oscarella lobularis]|uniref:uncharacterized protein n=1 Tax=Oscarella lobularis TaxID=121494 RepID=UPI003314126D